MADAEETPRGAATWETSGYERRCGRSCGSVPGKVRQYNWFYVFMVFSGHYREPFNEHRRTFGLGYVALSYLAEQSPSWELNQFSASQEILLIVWNPKVHYRIHEWRTPVHILSHLDPVHAPHPTYCRSIFILTSHPRLGLPSDILPSCFPNNTLYTPLLSPYVLHALPTTFLSISSPSSYLVISTVHNAHQYVAFSTPMFPFPLMPKYSLQHTIVEYPKSTFLTEYERPSFTHVQNDRQNYIYSFITSGKFCVVIHESCSNRVI